MSQPSATIRLATRHDLLRQGYKPRAVAMASLLAQDAGKPVQDVIKMKIINGSRSKE
ncbi:hypothetical protein [Sporolituus thermophilus]|uniref:hypothetical protein n=1 Tax=Sporolituus thermophilus TaxID=608505 RepID=UPI0014960058|nr:hypothetical protein [Sporolituus thermophilus]